MNSQFQTNQWRTPGHIGRFQLSISDKPVEDSRAYRKDSTLDFRQTRGSSWGSPGLWNLSYFLRCEPKRLPSGLPPSSPWEPCFIYPWFWESSSLILTSWRNVKLVGGRDPELGNLGGIMRGPAPRQSPAPRPWKPIGKLDTCWNFTSGCPT
jgi:hypothetical protein